MTDSNVLVRKAQIIGRMHLVDGLNMQDVLSLESIEVDGRKIIFGVICDGCSQDADGKPLHSEVGARLGNDFLSSEMKRLLISRTSISKIPAILHKRLSGYLRAQLNLVPLDTPQLRIKFVVEKFLFTVIGFIYTETETLIFYQGDGVYIVNDSVVVLDQNDKPTYIGYDAIDRRWLPSSVSALPQGYETLFFKSAEITKMAIASDSLGKEPDFYSELWGYSNPIGLQRKVNIWSLNDHKFKDDLSIITLEKPVAVETSKA